MINPHPPFVMIARRHFVTSCLAAATLGSGLIGLLPAQEEKEAPFPVAVVRVEFKGQIRSLVFRFYEEDAPETVANFKRLAEKNFYDGQAIHRAIPGYLIQTGDPLSKDDDEQEDWGTGGPGYTIPEEIGVRHFRGAVAMARLGDEVNPTRSSNGSQFYITLKDLPHLDGRYTVFGRLLTGYDVLDALAAANTDDNDVPVQRIEVLSVRIRMSDEVTATTDDAKPIKKAPKKERKSGPFGNFIKRFW